MGWFQNKLVPGLLYAMFGLTVANSFFAYRNRRDFDREHKSKKIGSNDWFRRNQLAGALAGSSASPNLTSSTATPTTTAIAATGTPGASTSSVNSSS
mmetsp:Transcript_17912/g.31140  ORF Transcript_17912/g.31140 Transcript_17912/m.31140 type:complete len:97 (-) Transcript_17912:948-1238(-)